MKAWLRRWLGVSGTGTILGAHQLELTHLRATNVSHAKVLEELEQQCHLLQNEIRELRAEVTRLMVASYVPPAAPEPKKKIVPTYTMKQYLAIVDSEREAQEAQSAD